MSFARRNNQCQLKFSTAVFAKTLATDFDATLTVSVKLRPSNVRRLAVVTLVMANNALVTLRVSVVTTLTTAIQLQLDGLRATSSHALPRVLCRLTLATVENVLCKKAFACSKKIRRFDACRSTQTMILCTHVRHPHHRARVSVFLARAMHLNSPTHVRALAR